MRCKNRNPHFKSSVAAFAGADQTLTATATPINFATSVTTETGVALIPFSNTLEVDYTGLYEFDFSVIVNATTAGDITVQAYENGSPMAETARTITVPVGFTAIDTETIRYIKAGCNETAQIQLYVNTDGTAAAVVDKATVTAMKLA